MESYVGRIVWESITRLGISSGKKKCDSAKEGGAEDKKVIHLVSWKSVCKPKEEGGLGIKNLELFNKALLLKWKWRIVKENDALWSEILRVRYINPKLKMFIDGGSKTRRDESIWETFPKAFPRATDKEGSIAEAISWESGVWVWNLLCNNDDPETVVAIEMKEVYRLLDDFEPLQDEEDELCVEGGQIKMLYG
ncbi:hypothetical protein KIW84_056590 [Lathyrus oleraceus]|uniref:Uncharacterized protein n=1 Tax=Pisum sativum TaxID=3888 RepID=A0A9D4WZX6_PEA|nr:hypothetical protein KIW84_056590 [Pisum sativum]